MNPKKLSSAVATAVVLISLSGLAGAAGGTYYRWVDASGTEVNSDRPPPAGIEYETVSTNTNLLQQEAQPEAPATAPAPSVAPEEAQGTAAPAGAGASWFHGTGASDATAGAQRAPTTGSGGSCPGGSPAFHTFRAPPGNVCS